MKRKAKSPQHNEINRNNSFTMDEESRGAFVPLGMSSPTASELGGNAESNDYERQPTSNADNNVRKKNGLREQLHSFHVMSAPYFRENRHGRILFAIMVVLTLANSAVRVFFSYLARDFWSALSDKNVEQFYGIMMKFVVSSEYCCRSFLFQCSYCAHMICHLHTTLVCFIMPSSQICPVILLAPITVAYRYQRQKLAIAWRKWLTGRVLRLYFTNKVYYALERQSGVVKSESGGDTALYNGQAKEVDNPDQRISEDIRSFTEFSLTFFLTLVTSVIDLVSFSFILFTIMPQLFIAIILFASIGTFLTICIGKVLIRLNYESLQKEANFRFSLVRVRENSESIAFYAGENVEERETDRRFDQVIDNMTMINVSCLLVALACFSNIQSTS